MRSRMTTSPSSRPLTRLCLGFASVLVGVACNGDAPESRRTLGPSIVTVQLPAQFGPLQRPVVEFDHAKHTKALENEKDLCQTCHLVDDQGDLISKLARKKDPTNRDTLVDLYHDKCIGCHEERSKQVQKSLPLACGECHVKSIAAVSVRTPMNFDYSLHERHVRELDSKCEDCHHLYDEKQKKLIYAKKKESACRDCHGQKDEGAALSLRNASHKDCITCHMGRKKDGQKHGPQMCTGCHDAKTRQEMKQLTDLPRIPRDQPDEVWIQTKGGRSKTVAFNHKGTKAFTAKVFEVVSVPSRINLSHQNSLLSRSVMVIRAVGSYPLPVGSPYYARTLISSQPAWITP